MLVDLIAHKYQLVLTDSIVPQNCREILVKVAARAHNTFISHRSKCCACALAVWPKHMLKYAHTTLTVTLAFRVHSDPLDH